MKVLVPTTIQLDRLQPHEFVEYDVRAAIPKEHRDAEVLVVWQNPVDALDRAATELNGLKLVQTLASGADTILDAGFVPSAAVCSGRSLHDGPVAEHVLALTLATVRRLDRLIDAQRRMHWDEEYMREQTAEGSRGLFTLDRAKVTIWGFGSIAARLAPLLTQLGADVEGIGRRTEFKNGYRITASTDAPGLLDSTDVLISLVPAGDPNTGLFGRTIFRALKPGAIFINAGRGTTVDESALLEALRSGVLRAAALDVVVTEPLPADSPLWGTENLIITPHVAGNRPQAASRLLERNLDALRTGAPLLNEVRPASTARV
ncbi:Glyoxylate/hydroxypyruvate reductase A [Arthrobacter sp. Bi83]|uniref:NAD(P)-dependent oxidoreductase n=1 Tax=Arthrobacter sp. Bi83 TaxID=2822353 RepID=UPI001DBA2D84|nr:NAD(P)-dependent oxidoreductase [Arthrobacter sp. Bi83]CAH0125271.1 Glyoxylate/hydroxypyruvate reductase A [Arthrobacter sp. Bi83]